MEIFVDEASKRLELTLSAADVEKDRPDAVYPSGRILGNVLTGIQAEHVWLTEAPFRGQMNIASDIVTGERRELLEKLGAYGTSGAYGIIICFDPERFKNFPADHDIHLTQALGLLVEGDVQKERLGLVAVDIKLRRAHPGDTDPTQGSSQQLPIAS